MFTLFMEYKHISSTGIDMSHIYRGYINNGIILVVATVYYFMCPFLGCTLILCLPMPGMR